MRAVVVAALLVACGDGDDSKKIIIPFPDVNAPDESYFCAICQVNGGCVPKSDASSDTHTFCTNIGACTGTGSCAVDGGHK